MRRVRFAGFDPSERNWVRIPTGSVRAYNLFKSGHDTMSVAEIIGCEEHTAQKLIAIGRSHFLGLPPPYEGMG